MVSYHASVVAYAVGVGIDVWQQIDEPKATALIRQIREYADVECIRACKYYNNGLTAHRATAQWCESH